MSLESRFLQTLQNSKAKEKFRSFLRGEYNDETLAFYEEIQSYEQIDGSDERRTRAAKMFETYLTEFSPRSVNVGPRSIQAMQEKLTQKNKTLETNIWDDIKREVFVLMANDPFTRFMASKETKSKSNNNKNKTFTADQIISNTFVKAFHTSCDKTDDVGWVYNGEKRNIKLYTKDCNSSTAYACKGVGVVDASPEEVADNFMALDDRRKKRDAHFVEGWVLEKLSRSDDVVYQHFKLSATLFSKPLRRDFVLARCHRVEQDGTHIIVCRDTTHEDAPAPPKGCSRAICTLVGYKISPMRGKAQSSLVYSIHEYDLGSGKEITPKVLREMEATRPLVINKLQKALRKSVDSDIDDDFKSRDSVSPKNSGYKGAKSKAGIFDFVKHRNRKSEPKRRLARSPGVERFLERTQSLEEIDTKLMASDESPIHSGKVAVLKRKRSQTSMSTRVLIRFFMLNALLS